MYFRASGWQLVAGHPSKSEGLWQPVAFEPPEPPRDMGCCLADRTRGTPLSSDDVGRRGFVIVALVGPPFAARCPLDG